jgi:predicted kinase
MIVFNRTPILIVMMGIPGSGKSSVRNLFDLSEWHLGSSDEKIPVGEDGNRQWTPSNLRESWKEVWKEFGQALGERKNIILDNTFIHRNERAAIAGIAKGLGYSTILVWLKTSLERCLENDRRRRYMVGANVIAHKYTSLQKPSYGESWDEIIKITDSDNGMIVKEDSAISFLVGHTQEQNAPITLPEYINKVYGSS